MFDVTAHLMASISGVFESVRAEECVATHVSKRHQPRLRDGLTASSARTVLTKNLLSCCYYEFYSQAKKHPHL